MRGLAGQADFNAARGAVDRPFHHADMAEWQAGKIVQREGIVRLNLLEAGIGDDGRRTCTGFFRRLVEKDDAAGLRTLSGKAKRQRRQNGRMAVMAAKVALAVDA